MCSEVTPANIEDVFETALMKSHKETYVTAVGDTSLRAVDESGKSHRPVDLNACLVLKASVGSNTFVQSIK